MSAIEKIFVDTSGWYAFLNARDSAYSSVQNYLSRSQETLVTSNFIITELLNLLVARRQKRLALEFGQTLREKSEVLIFSISSEDEEEAWSIFQKYQDHDFSFTDCTSFALMARLKIKKSLALDDDFAAMGFELIPKIKL